MTASQKHSQNFEEIAEEVVKRLLDGSNAKISRTRPQKDGGFDIVAQCFDGISEHKIFFECKLRGENLNLRDIAANAVIAFNHGAVGLVAMANYDYTPQLEDELSRFCKKAVLNVKILVGIEIRQIILDNQIKASDELLALLMNKKSRRKGNSKLLRLDFTKSDIYKQLLYKDASTDAPLENYLTKLWAQDLAATARHLHDGYTVLVSGYAGVGKSGFISAAIDRCQCRRVCIDAHLYETQEQFLLDLLVQIWGIPERLLLCELTEEYIGKISTILGEQENDWETAQIIRRLLGGSSAGGAHNIHFNSRVCKYLISLLSIHKGSIKYVFYLENLQSAHQEICELLFYLIKLLQNDKTGCIVEYRVEEYAHETERTSFSGIAHLSRSIPVQVDILDSAQAIAYLRDRKPELPNTAARMIVDMVGCRLCNLSLTLNYLDRRGVDFENPREIAREVDAVTPNDIPNVINKYLPFFSRQHQPLFYLLGLLRGKVPYELLSDVVPDLGELDALLETQILVYKQGYITPTNEFVYREIVKGIYPPRMQPLEIANRMLERIENSPDRHQAVRIQLLYYTQRYQETLNLIDSYIPVLREERQYSALLQYFDIAIDSAAKRKDSRRRADYMVQELDVIVIKKEIIKEKAGQLLDELSNLLATHHVGDVRGTYQLAHDYFMGKRVFKLGRISLDERIFQINCRHYEMCVSGDYTDNTGDWLGRVCCNYAMFVKEIHGNGPALTVFINAVSALPDSFELRREYYSHKACMCLYSEPMQAYDYYEKIIQSFEGQTLSCALPFHEYGDLAMSLLLAQKYENAVSQAEEGIVLADSYGVVDEVGRITNIKGCAFLCMGRLADAKREFIEATVIMERSGYQLYCWRSRLNMIQMELPIASDPHKQRAFLQETYADFKMLFRPKVLELVAAGRDALFQTREYHALLIFGTCFQFLNCPMEEKIAEEFELGNLSGAYRKHVVTLAAHPGSKVIPNSPYFSHGKIFMIG